MAPWILLITLFFVVIYMGDIERKFETLRFKHNQQAELLLKALDHVKHFIVQHKLVLVGGMAIDCALRLRGTKLYGDDALADYDFYSPKNAEHAYLLGSELCSMEFPNVDVITAIHTTTMKVRVDGNVVADITYMPPTVFERLRTLEYQGMRIVHPWMVMMDQFRSLSTPYENPPNEVIFERWSKDTKRLGLLLQAYTLGDEDADVKLPKLQEVDLPDLGKNTGSVVLSAYQGWAALAHWEAEILPEAERVFHINPKTSKALLPVDYCTVVTADVGSWMERYKDAKFFNPLFSYPRHFRARKIASGDFPVEVFDFWGERTTLHPRMTVVSLPALMYYFLHTWLLRGDEKSLVGVRRTHLLIRMQNERKHENLSVRPLGEQSWNTSTLYSIANILDHERVKNWKPQTQNFGKNKDGTQDCSIRRRFDPAQSPLFSIDESETTEFKPVVPPEQLQIK
jgi:hypothetical protein